jgi:hypothetical protein
MHKIDTYIPNGDVIVHNIFLEGKVAGNVIICNYDNYTEVLHIFVEPKHRDKDLAKELVKYLQDNYDYIITGWSSSEKAGQDLFLKMGFRVKKAIHKNRTTNLEWRKIDRPYKKL